MNEAFVRHYSLRRDLFLEFSFIILDSNFEALSTKYDYGIHYVSSRTKRKEG